MAPGTSEALSTDLRPRSEALATAMMPQPGSSREVAGTCSIFPFGIARCCPCLPSSWTKVQDWLHLTLLLGVLATLLCVIQLIQELAWGDSCASYLCYKQIISGVCVLPSTIYFIKTIGSYDEQLREKKQRHQSEVNNLLQAINQQVGELQQLCGDIAQNANAFATGRFKDKADGFIRFLKQLKVNYKDSYTDEQLVEELRNFVLKWLHSFSGILLNPQQNPILRGAEDELRGCRTAEQVCERAIRRIEDFRITIDMQFQQPANTPRLTGQASVTSASFSSTTSNFSDLEANTSSRCGVTWLKCGRWRGCGCRRASTADGYPYTADLGHLELVMLSRGHVTLMVAFVMDILLVLFEVFSARWTSFVLVSVNEVCVVSMLACWEQIDEIARLERQIRVYEGQQEDVQRRKEEANERWDKVQQLHDLWRYRSLPTLAIMGKVHNRLSDMDMDGPRIPDSPLAEDPRLEFMRLSNAYLLAFETKLGPVEDWAKRRDQQWKESIGQRLLDLEKKPDVEALLPELCLFDRDLSALEDGPLSTASEDRSVRSTPQGSPFGSPRSTRSSVHSGFGGATASSSAPLPPAATSSQQQRPRSGWRG